MNTKRASRAIPRRGSLLVVTLWVLWALAGCAAEGFDEAQAGGDFSNNGAANNGTNNGTNNGDPVDNGTNNGTNNGSGSDNNSGEPEPYIPEEEALAAFQAPRSSRNFVFVANPELDSVAKIDADTLEIISIETGDRPTQVETRREENLAVVLNEGSAEVTIIRAGDSRDYVVNLPIPASMNALALSPQGDFALVWFDFARAQQDPEFNLGEAAPPFQDVALVRLAEGEEEVFHLTVGFQVLDLEFDEAGERAFVITRTGISVVALGSIQGDRAIPPISVAEVDAEDETDREVEITDDGQYAFVRSAGLEGLNVVDLNDRRVTLVALSSVPTDLDLVPGQNRALAVIRGSDELALIDLPGALEDPEGVRVLALGDTNVGQAELSPDARKALLFTTVEERPEISVVDLESETIARYPLRKGVRRVAIGPEATSAVIFHTKLPGLASPGEPEDQFIAKSWAYSILDLNTGYTKIETIPTEQGEFVFGESQRLYLLLNDPLAGVRQVEIIDLETFGTSTLALGSPPLHVGTIPNEGSPRIYISQDHPLGRMTFINEVSREVKTVTGFELNSNIE
jgi:hypothetical protein